VAVKAKIVNDEPEGSQVNLSVEVVTVGVNAGEGTKHLLAPQQSVSVEVSKGQFVMVDTTEKEAQ
jgi:hypothetical protein